MYLQHFGLNREPFHITPDPRFFYLSPSHKEAFASLIYGLKNRKGFMAVIGEVGLGKTTVLRTFLQHSDAQQTIKTIFVFNPNITFLGLLHIIYDELGLARPSSASAPQTSKEVQADSDELFQLVHTLHRSIIHEFEQGFTVVLVIDEAQNMPVQTLEHLRMLSNLETSTEKLLQIILIGQPELEKTLNRPELRQLKQRIAIRSILRPLTWKQTREYIRHRLRKAGAEQDPIFSTWALYSVYRKSKGTPRTINILCDNALITAFGYDQSKVTARIVREVNKDLSGKSFQRSKAWMLAVPLLVAVLGLGAWQSLPYLPEGIRQTISHWNQKVTQPKDKENTGNTAMVYGNHEPKRTQSTSQSLESNSFPISQEHKASDSSADVQGNTFHSYQPGDGKIPDTGHDQNTLPQEVNSSASESTMTPETRKAEPVQSSKPQADISQPTIPPMGTQEKRLAQELHSKFSFYKQLSPIRQRVLIEMVKQTSLQGFSSFENMIQALQKKNFTEASRQMRYSHWHSRVGQPAAALAAVMASGKESDLRDWLVAHGEDT
jgi:general secretion pathway protein A